ncbi:MAG: hypothetical protein IT245_05895 [Bacteroidia bacterium]|nr:hypothetical protein [Bacteroidia bacterium]
MKNIISILLMSLFMLTNVSSQIALSPNPQQFGICPNINKTFTITGIPSNCSGWTISKDDGVTNSITTSGNTFTVNAANIPQNIVVKFNPGTDTDCGSAKTFTIPVISVSTKTPTITGCPSGGLVAGIATTVTLNAELLYQFKGTSDPTEVTSYAWSIISGGTGWTMTTTNAPSVIRKTATLVTNNCSGATIRVIATDLCGNVTFPSIRSSILQKEASNYYFQ